MTERFANLIGLGPEGESHRWPLDKEKNMVGRKPPADIVLLVPRISRLHAQILVTEKGYVLTDLDSRNGTFVNGERIPDEGIRLTGGDRIVFGGVVSVVFDDPDETAAGPQLGRLRGVWIDNETKVVWVDSKRIEPKLSAAQYTLLELLYDRPNQIISRGEIVAAVWPKVDPAGVSNQAVNSLIKRLKGRLRAHQTEEIEYLEVLRGHGICLHQPD